VYRTYESPAVRRLGRVEALEACESRRTLWGVQAGRASSPVRLVSFTRLVN